MTSVIDVCDACGATGRYEGGRGQEPRPCHYCNGTGFLTMPDEDECEEDDGTMYDTEHSELR